MDNITIEFSEVKVKTIAYICNFKGQIVKVIELKSNKELIDKKDLPSGFYIFTLPTSSKKLIKI